MLTLDKIYQAAFVLKDVVRETALLPSPKINPKSEVYLKPENMQFTGAYKVRGAYYTISTLTDEERAKGLITASIS